MAPFLLPVFSVRLLARPGGGRQQRLAGLRHLAAVDEAVGTFLDEWAVRQAKRKAPQLSDVDAVLAYRHRRRTERQAQRKALTAAFRPLQGRALVTRLKKLLAAVKSAR